jgi:hypothetical protein
LIREDEEMVRLNTAPDGRTRISVWLITAALAAVIVAAVVTVSLAPTTGPKLLPAFAGVLTAVAISIPVFRRQREWRRRLHQAAAGGSDPQRTLLCAASPRFTNSPVALRRTPYPYDSGLGTIAVTLRAHQIEFWGYIRRAPVLLVTVHRDLVEFSYDESRDPSTLEIKWPAYHVSLVPVFTEGIVRRRIPAERWKSLIEEAAPAAS